MSSKIILRVTRLGALTLLVLLPGDVHAGETADAPTPIRIGWQIPTATQGQIAQILKRTDVLERNGLEPRLIPFSYGEPQIEAAFAGRLDVFFAGDQPVLDLIARGGRWTIVARLMYDRVAVMVPLDSEIQDVDDLRGTTVASPLGSVAHREAIRAEEAAGIDPQAEVTNADMDILEIRRRVLAGGDQSWSGMDAAVVWEPLVSRLEHEGIARRLTETRTLGVVAVADDFIANHPEATVQLLVAVTRAWSYFARNPEPRTGHAVVCRRRTARLRVRNAAGRRSIGSEFRCDFGS